jgi:adenylosuccinate lyase
MSQVSLFAISPLDGRYFSKVEPLRSYFSELALFKYRLKVEVEYFILLCEWGLQELPTLSQAQQDALRYLYLNFDLQAAESIKEIEKVTNHDVKALEYYLKAQLEKQGLGQWKEFVHFGLTSQDVNNTAVPLLIKDAYQQKLQPVFHLVVDELKSKAKDWANIPMLARTHGQAASPTRLGKELMVFVERIENQLEELSKLELTGKFGGATGNFNAHHFAYPEVDWIHFGNEFVKKLGLKRNQYTTQIDHYDSLACLFDGLRRINIIMLDACRDIWQYISMSYFIQKTVEGEVGSSAMPHKVNPIDFENAEGNLGIANALFGHFSEKLPISRLQRDLSDSTVLRNVGVPFAHTYLAADSFLKGLSKLEINAEAIRNDLLDQQVVVVEGIQTLLRRIGYPEPYEALKQLSRGKKQIGLPDIHAFINQLEVSSEIKQRLLSLTAENYTGISF